MLPTVEPSMIPPTVLPLLIFVNVKSGGCQVIIILVLNVLVFVLNFIIQNTDFHFDQPGTWADIKLPQAAESISSIWPFQRGPPPRYADDDDDDDEDDYDDDEDYYYDDGVFSVS